jgi:hypothetical protein
MRELNTTRRAGKSQKFRLEIKPGASAHRPRSADLQSAVSRICNPQGMNSSTAAGQLARRRLQIGDTAGLEPALRDGGAGLRRFLNQAKNWA